MKFIHLSDLHLGKRVNEFSMLEDQEYILRKILRVIDDERPEGVIIAGDVYDKPVPSAEAVSLFDDFLCKLAKRQLQVFVISGNHDSTERIAFASRIMDTTGIHMSPVYSGKVEPVRLNDAYGELNIYMLPFIKPAQVRRYFEDAEIGSYTDALRCAVEEMQVDPAKRNVLVTHQFVTGASRTESEDISVGGADNVDAEVFRDFDYVALGHLHSPQNCGGISGREGGAPHNREGSASGGPAGGGAPLIRYCGSPLKYSFSEAGDRKSVTVVELQAKGELSVRTVELVPKHDMVELKGRYEELTLKAFYENTTWRQDYVHITLTDEEDIPDAIGRLRVIYENLMKLDYDNTRTRSNAVIEGDERAETKTPYELFADFYELQNNQPLSDEQAGYMKALIGKVWEEEG